MQYLQNRESRQKLSKGKEWVFVAKIELKSLIHITFPLQNLVTMYNALQNAFLYNSKIMFTERKQTARLASKLDVKSTK